MWQEVPQIPAAASPATRARARPPREPWKSANCLAATPGNDPNRSATVTQRSVHSPPPCCVPLVRADINLTEGFCCCLSSPWIVVVVVPASPHPSSAVASVDTQQGILYLIDAVLCCAITESCLVDIYSLRRPTNDIVKIFLFITFR